MGIKEDYRQKLTLLSTNCGDSENILQTLNSLGSFGISVLEEAVLVRSLGERHEVFGDRLAEIFIEKRLHAQDDPKHFGYGILHKKKFCERATIREAYTYFEEKKLLNSRAWVGITENITGRFLFFDQARKIPQWIRDCIDVYKESLEDVIQVFDNVKELEDKQSMLVHL